MGKKVIKVYLGEDLYGKLREYCRKNNLPISSFVSSLLSMFFDGRLVSPRCDQRSQFGPANPQPKPAVTPSRRPVLRGGGLLGFGKYHHEIMKELKEVIKNRRVE